MTLSNNITENEKEAVEELKQRIKGDIEPEMYEDNDMFLRFLRAQDMNISNAEAMLRRHLEWRKKNDVTNIMKFKKPEVLEKYISYTMIGHDKEGSVIRYAPFGIMDYIGIISSNKFEDIVKLVIYELESDTLELKKQSEKLGRNVDDIVCIYDFRDYPLASAIYKDGLYLGYQIIQIFLNNYPERLKACHIINVTKYFQFLFSALKPLIPKTVLEKIHLYSDDSYKEELLKEIDADVLPAFLGGNRTDPDGDPLCHTIINHPGPVPKSYYLPKGKHLLSKAEDVQKITLSNAAFHEVNLDVKEAGSYLEWEFETKARDIGFGLFYNELVNEEEKITELLSIQRIDTEQYPETGTFRCKRSGKYVIVFDNTYSWVREKEIYFRTKVVTPEEHEAEIKE